MSLTADQCAALAQLRSQHPQARIVLIGAGALELQSNLGRSTADVDVIVAINLEQQAALADLPGWRRGRQEHEFTAANGVRLDIDRREMARSAVARCAGARVVVVGDSAADVLAARHVGVPVLITATGPEQRSALEALRPDSVVDDLTSTEAVASWLLAQLNVDRAEAE